MKSGFVQLLEKVSKEAFDEQSGLIEKYFIEWEDDEEQIDNVIVIQL